MTDTSDIVWDDDPHSGVVWDDEQSEPAKPTAKVPTPEQQSFAASLLPDFATGAGKSFGLVARKFSNLLQQTTGSTPSSDPNSYASDSNIKQYEKDAAPAFNTPGGSIGKATAENLATIPIGGPVEGAVAKLGSTVLPKLAARFPSLMSAAGAGVSGATSAAAMADPGQRGTAATEGGVLSGTMSLLGSGGGRMARGLVQKSNELQNLEGDVQRAMPDSNLFVPVSQGADVKDLTSSIIGQTYKSALPYFPGVENQIKNQSKAASTLVKSAQLQNAAPEGFTVPPTAAEDMQLSTQQVKNEYDRIYQNLRQVNNISIPKNFDADLKARIMAADPKIPESAVDQHVAAVRSQLNTESENSPSGRIDAWNLKNVRDNIQAMNSDTPMPQRNGLINTSKDAIDDLFSNKLQQSFNLNQPKTQQILNDYKVNAANYENFRPLKQAVDNAVAKRGDYRFGSVATKANDGTNAQNMDQIANAVLGSDNPATKLTQGGRYMTYGAKAAAGALAVKTGGTSLIPTAALVGAAQGLGSKAFQRALYGDTALQKLTADKIAQNPVLAKTLGFLSRNAVATEVGDAN